MQEHAQGSTRDKDKVSTVEMQIAARSRNYPGEALTNLSQFIDEDFLKACFKTLNKQSASGVDGQSWQDYNEQLTERVTQLLTAFKEGSYKAPHIRRVYIPKEDGSERPLGIPTIEDKLLQTAVSKVLTPVYEEMFYPHSYGFRPGKSAHQALEELFKEVSFKGKRYIIDADIKNYFGTINLVQLREFLDLRIKDGVIRKMLDKWLKAGIREGHQVMYPTEGTPQGGSISPLLSNIFLHYVLDEWFVKEIQPRLVGESFIIRFADDFLLGFTREEDAIRVKEVLFKRFAKYGITLHPDKTRMIKMSFPDEDNDTFDFLGFTHYMGKSLKGKEILKRQTSKKKLRSSLKKMNAWLKGHRHAYSFEGLIIEMNRKLRGYYEYNGITFNSRQLSKYYEQVKRLLFKWINRRGNQRLLSWEQYGLRIEVWSPLLPPSIRHSYRLAKP
jgi:RNA-directed DNA polymerase